MWKSLGKIKIEMWKRMQWNEFLEKSNQWNERHCDSKK